MMEGPTVRGVSCSIPNQYGDYLRQILDGIDLSDYKWRIWDDEVLFFDKEENRLRTDFFLEDELSGDIFKQCITRNDYYVIFADIQAYPINRTATGTSDTAINVLPSKSDVSYGDFLASGCQIILLIYDVTYLESYIKAPVITERIFQNCVHAGCSDVEYITDENDSRTRLSVW